jgi:chemotaxis protein CheD
MSNTLAVGLAELKISRDPNDVLVAFGLGSCLGIGIFDPQLHLGGLLHAVLPKYTHAKESRSPKFVDSGIQYMLEEMEKLGLNRSRMIIRVAGGANMLNLKGSATPFDIGTRNIESAHTLLEKLNYKVKNEDTGGQTGRTVRLYVCDGRMTIRIMGGKEREF